MSRFPLAEFRSAFGDDQGVLPDGLVPQSVREDWSSVLRLAADQGWAASWIDDGSAVTTSDLLEKSRDMETFALRPIPGVQINCFTGDEVRFDIDLREYTSQVALDVLCDVIARLGSALGKPVILFREGGFDDEVVRFDPDSGQFALRGRPGV